MNVLDEGQIGSASLAGTLARVRELIDLGGPVVVILGFMSIIALTILFLKLWQFRSLQLGDRRTAREMLRLYRGGRGKEAVALACRSRNPVAQVLALAIRGRRRSELSEARVREEVVRVAADQLEALRSYFRPLEVIASLAPLLGLFGTVLGMITAFQQLQQAGNQVDPAILSGGIWEALLTTAVGLGVAIPVVVVINWLERKIDRLAHEMQSTVTQVFTLDLLQTAEDLAPSAESAEGDDERYENAGFRADDIGFRARVAGE
ncbi:MotA/TolQ/ExbB proton channel family protein [Nitrococcus mobilis]|uniref:MotA/TolQ/ExbB proton channel family protein n=1 Tax=Nitrococcus mobilis Nb-231 TaxID=314278 RepID=A4BLY1_9GAMM|nr:MotA/TolQ/ExbB proton channel family protein [Nitrococcus mobilis]EAR23319.1 MotA/TolQ/ExbB proton channel family protein [Nitrococcus mobilis Nb-231]